MGGIGPILSVLSLATFPRSPTVSGGMRQYANWVCIIFYSLVPGAFYADPLDPPTGTAQHGAITQGGISIVLPIHPEGKYYTRPDMEHIEPILYRHLLWYSNG